MQAIALRCSFTRKLASDSKILDRKDNNEIGIYLPRSCDDYDIKFLHFNLVSSA